MNDEQPAGEIGSRKAQHIELALRDSSQFSRSTGLERYELRHEAIPELSLEHVNPETTFLGHRLTAPIIVSGMTGGTARAGQINRRLAETVAKFGLGMGVGSQRISVEHPEVLETFQVRSVAPEILLIANIGAVQLNYGFTVDDCRRLVDSINADALALHLNPLQEAIQVGGNTDFRGLLNKLEKLCSDLDRPLIVKEVGCGITGPTARRLADCGVAAIDVGGAGGTCWTEIEAQRSNSQETKSVAATFREWGTPTAECIRSVRADCPAIPLVASGGLRTGLDIAKCLALGANLTAIASPALKAAVESSEAIGALLHRLIAELKLAMFCTGSAHPDALRTALSDNRAR